VTFGCEPGTTATHILSLIKLIFKIMIVNNPSGKNQTCEIHPSATIPHPMVEV
jgi:hypothetical protein